MNARNTVRMIAAAALGAWAAAAWAHAPGRDGTGCAAVPHCATPGAGAAMRMRSGPDPGVVQARLDRLEAALALRPEQLAAWNAYEARVKAQLEQRVKMREAMRSVQGDAQALADLRVAWMKQRAQAAEEINGLRKALYAILTPEQKATFDRFRPAAAGHGPRRWRGCGV